MKTKVLLKDILFSKEKVKIIAQQIKMVYSKFDDKAFIKDVVKKFPELELKHRMYWMRKMFEKYLPTDYNKSLRILLDSLASLDSLDQENLFVYATHSDFIEANGCDKKNLKTSLNALGVFTKHCSSEFGVRPFINKFPKETLAKMLSWSKSKNVHQRRLASEGLRPKLPWAQAINFDYKKGAEPLDNLFYDKERYVTRSVANHLNDISKIDPDFVVSKLAEWKKSKKQNNLEMRYIINHSLRTLIKKGNKNALKFLGYNSSPKIEVKNLKILNPKIKIGESINFSFDVLAKADENLIIDFVVTYATPRKHKSQKVFKIKGVKLKKGESLLIKKKQTFKKMTTKKLYSGKHILEIQINGKIFDLIFFNLKI